LNEKLFFSKIENDLFLEHDPGLYNFINQGMLTIDKVDDCAEMKDTKKAFEILLFTEVIDFILF
jgi:myosin heavy subunit